MPATQATITQTQPPVIVGYDDVNDNYGIQFFGTWSSAAGNGPHGLSVTLEHTGEGTAFQETYTFPPLSGESGSWDHLFSFFPGGAVSNGRIKAEIEGWSTGWEAFHVTSDETIVFG